jgi:predicted NAD-dependent protein-ADP-ribosyltransferase YbiA (DUF1768 family)
MITHRQSAVPQSFTRHRDDHIRRLIRARSVDRDCKNLGRHPSWFEDATMSVEESQFIAFAFSKTQSRTAMPNLQLLDSPASGP